MPALAGGHVLQDRYRIVRQLGQGGMGAVYLAEDLRLPGRMCAIKVNLVDLSADPQMLRDLRSQFQMEARTLATLDHPNLPKVSDYFSDTVSEYLVMDYVEGENLAGLLRRTSGPLPEHAVLAWADQVLDALEYLHNRRPQPLIHRDIKPANIILTAQDKIKLVDFGLIKLIDPGDPRTMTVLKGAGTPDYAPLEQFASGYGHTDARSDIYSLGATLYCLLTGTPPADTHVRLLKPEQLVPPRRLNPSLSPQTETVILKAIEIYPDNRFQSSRAMREALTPAAPTHVSAPTVVAPPQPPRTAGPATRSGLPLFAIAAGILVVLLLAGAIWLLSRNNQERGVSASTPTTVGVIVGTATPTEPGTATPPALLPATATPTMVPVTNTPAVVATEAPAATTQPPTTAPPPTATVEPATNTPAAACPPAAITVGGYVEVAYARADGVALRRTPGTAGKDDATDVIGALFAGERYRAVDGPLLQGGLTWWRLATPFGVGWSAQATSVYTLLAPTCQAPDPAGPACPAPGIAVGRYVEVVYSGADGVSARRTPGYVGKNDASDVVATLYPPQRFRVAQGPRNADGLTWWLVQGSFGAGWVAEKSGVNVVLIRPSCPPA